MKKPKLEAKKIVKEKKERYRVPRPLGFTYALISIHKKQETEDSKDTLTLNKLKQKIIELWINDNMRLNGKATSINQLANYLNMPSNQVLILMNKELMRVANFMDDEDGKQIARALTFQGLKKCLEIMAQSQAQTDILMASQGTKYKAFESTEVNRSIANLITSQKPLQDYIKMLTDKIADNPYVNPSKKFGNTGNRYITPDEANNMVQNQSSLLTSPEYLQAIENNLGALPDVNARNQDLTSIGIGLKKTTILIPDKPNYATKGLDPHAEHHDTRRQKSEHITDIEADDFKA